MTDSTISLTREHIISSFVKKPDCNISVFPVLDSTNAEARRMIDHCFFGRALIVADRQTAGRGRLGRNFFSPAGVGLYLTLLCRLPNWDGHPVPVTAAAAVAVSRGIERVAGRSVGIKWVNDLFWEGKKVCGILAESAVTAEGRFLILGIGINIAPSIFPPELAETVGSLSSLCDRNRLCAAISEELFAFLDSPASYLWIEDYRKRSTVLGREIVWTEGGKTHVGTATAIDGEGALLVSDSGGLTHRLFSGEISLRLREHTNTLPGR